VEADAGGALLDDFATGCVVDLLGRAHHGLELLLRQPFEDRNRLEHRFCVLGSCHAILLRLHQIIDETMATGKRPDWSGGYTPENRRQTR
jgi:hypothetical protein